MGDQHKGARKTDLPNDGAVVGWSRKPGEPVPPLVVGKLPRPLCAFCGKRDATPSPDELTLIGAAPEAGHFCDDCRAKLSKDVKLSDEERAAVRMARLYGVPITRALLRAASRARADLEERGLILPGIEKRAIRKAQRSNRDDQEQAAEDRAKAEGKTLADLAREKGQSDAAPRMRRLRRRKRLAKRR